MEAIEVRNDYREAAMLVNGDDQMKQEQVTAEMETFEDDLQNLLKVCYTRMIKKIKNLKGKNSIVLQKVRKQGIRFWDERTFWHEIIYKSVIPTFGKPAEVSQK